MSIVAGVHSSKKRNDAVDALRAVLIFSVVAFHYLVFWTPPYQIEDHYHYSNSYPAWFVVGSFGVQVFFMISGYVITMTLERSSGSFDFLYRRFSRLFPALFVCSLLTYLFVVFSHSDIVQNLTFKDWIATLLLHPEKLNANYVDGSYWSLGVEVRYYIWVAVFYALLGKRLWLGVCAIGIATIAQDLVGWHVTSFWMDGKHISYFLIGMSFRYFEKGNQRTAAASTLLIGLAVYWWRMSDLAFGDFQYAANAYILVLGCFLFIATNTSLLDNMRLGPLPYLGRISYCFYLLHQTIGVTIIGKLNAAGSTDELSVAVALATTLLLAALIYNVIEVPGQQMLRRRVAVITPEPMPG